LDIRNGHGSGYGCTHICILACRGIYTMSIGDRNTIIHLKGIHFGYPGGKEVLRNLDFELHRGERIGLIAPNGSGKTTLFHLIMGLLKPQSGRISLFGKVALEEKDFLEPRHRIGMLFQDADDQLFSPTVLEDVAFGPLNLGKSKREAVDIAKETLNFLGLSGFENRLTFKLSGGEKKLVSLATVLAMKPEVLLLDEPVNGLDAKTKAQLTDILCDLDVSYVLISHDLEFLNATTKVVYTMGGGRIILDQAIKIHEHIHAHPHGTYPHSHE